MGRVSKKELRGGRPYIEAFPVLDLLTAEKQWRLGKRVCQWTNEKGLIVGYLRIEELDAEGMVAKNNFFGAVNVGTNRKLMAASIRWHRRANAPNRAMFECPRCRRPTAKIILVAGKWGCSACHQLCTVRRRLNHLTKNIRRLFLLEPIVKEGRKKSQRIDKFEKIREEYGSLMLHFRDHHLPDELSYNVTGEWYKDEDPVLLHTKPRGSFVDYIWEPGGTGGFKELHWRHGKEKGRRATRSEIERHMLKRTIREMAEADGINAAAKPERADCEKNVAPAPGWADPTFKRPPVARRVACAIISVEDDLDPE